MTSEEKTPTDETQGSGTPGSLAPANEGPVQPDRDKKMKPLRRLVSTLKGLSAGSWLAFVLAPLIGVTSAVFGIQLPGTDAAWLPALTVTLALIGIVFDNRNKKQVIEATERVTVAVGKDTRTEVGKAIGDAHEATRKEVGDAHKETRTEVGDAHKKTRIEVGDAHKDMRKVVRESTKKLVEAHEQTRIIATTSAVFSAIGVIEGNLTTLRTVVRFLPTVSDIGEDSEDEIVSRLRDCERRTAKLINRIRSDAKLGSHGES